MFFSGTASDNTDKFITKIPTQSSAADGLGIIPPQSNEIRKINTKERGAAGRGMKASEKPQVNPSNFKKRCYRVRYREDQLKGGNLNSNTAKASQDKTNVNGSRANVKRLGNRTRIICNRYVNKGIGNTGRPNQQQGRKVPYTDTLKTQNVGTLRGSGIPFGIDSVSTKKEPIGDSEMKEISEMEDPHIEVFIETNDSDETQAIPERNSEQIFETISSVAPIAEKKGSWNFDPESRKKIYTDEITPLMFENNDKSGQSNLNSMSPKDGEDEKVTYNRGPSRSPENVDDPVILPIVKLKQYPKLQNSNALNTKGNKDIQNPEYSDTKSLTVISKDKNGLTIVNEEPSYKSEVDQLMIFSNISHIPESKPITVKSTSDIQSIFQTDESKDKGKLIGGTPRPIFQNGSMKVNRPENIPGNKATHFKETGATPGRTPLRTESRLEKVSDIGSKKTPADEIGSMGSISNPLIKGEKIEPVGQLYKNQKLDISESPFNPTMYETIARTTPVTKQVLDDEEILDKLNSNKSTSSGGSPGAVEDGRMLDEPGDTNINDQDSNIGYRTDELRSKNQTSKKGSSDQKYHNDENVASDTPDAKKFLDNAQESAVLNIKESDEPVNQSWMLSTSKQKSPNNKKPVRFNESAAGKNIFKDTGNDVTVKSNIPHANNVQMPSKSTKTNGTSVPNAAIADERFLNMQVDKRPTDHNNSFVHTLNDPGISRSSTTFIPEHELPIEMEPVGYHEPAAGKNTSPDTSKVSRVLDDNMKTPFRDQNQWKYYKGNPTTGRISTDSGWSADSNNTQDSINKKPNLVDQNHIPPHKTKPTSYDVIKPDIPTKGQFLKNARIPGVLDSTAFSPSIKNVYTSDSAKLNDYLLYIQNNKSITDQNSNIAHKSDDPDSETSIASSAESAETDIGNNAPIADEQGNKGPTDHNSSFIHTLNKPGYQTSTAFIPEHELPIKVKPVRYREPVAEKNTLPDTSNVGRVLDDHIKKFSPDQNQWKYDKGSPATGTGQNSNGVHKSHDPDGRTSIAPSTEYAETDVGKNEHELPKKTPFRSLGSAAAKNVSPDTSHISRVPNNVEKKLTSDQKQLEDDIGGIPSLPLSGDLRWPTENVFKNDLSKMSNISYHGHIPTTTITADIPAGKQLFDKRKKPGELYSKESSQTNVDKYSSDAAIADKRLLNDHRNEDIDDQKISIAHASGQSGSRNSNTSTSKYALPFVAEPVRFDESPVDRHTAPHNDNVRRIAGTIMKTSPEQKELKDHSGILASDAISAVHGKPVDKIASNLNLKLDMSDFSHITPHIPNYALHHNIPAVEELLDNTKIPSVLNPISKLYLTDKHGKEGATYQDSSVASTSGEPLRRNSSSSSSGHELPIGTKMVGYNEPTANKIAFPDPNHDSLVPDNFERNENKNENVKNSDVTHTTDKPGRQTSSSSTTKAGLSVTAEPIIFNDTVTEKGSFEDKRWNSFVPVHWNKTVSPDQKHNNDHSISDELPRDLVSPRDFISRDDVDKKLEPDVFHSRKAVATDVSMNTFDGAVTDKPTTQTFYGSIPRPHISIEIESSGFNRRTGEISTFTKTSHVGLSTNYKTTVFPAENKLDDSGRPANKAASTRHGIENPQMLGGLDRTLLAPTDVGVHDTDTTVPSERMLNENRNGNIKYQGNNNASSRATTVNILPPDLKKEEYGETQSNPNARLPDKNSSIKSLNSTGKSIPNKSFQESNNYVTKSHLTNDLKVNVSDKKSDDIVGNIIKHTDLNVKAGLADEILKKIDDSLREKNSSTKSAQSNPGTDIIFSKNGDTDDNVMQKSSNSSYGTKSPEIRNSFVNTSFVPNNPDKIDIKIHNETDKNINSVPKQTGDDGISKMAGKKLINGQESSIEANWEPNTLDKSITSVKDVGNSSLDTPAAGNVPLSKDPSNIKGDRELNQTIRLSDPKTSHQYTKSIATANLERNIGNVAKKTDPNSIASSAVRVGGNPSTLKPIMGMADQATKQSGTTAEPSTEKTTITKVNEEATPDKEVYGLTASLKATAGTGNSYNQQSTSTKDAPIQKNDGFIATERASKIPKNLVTVINGKPSVAIAVDTNRDSKGKIKHRFYIVNPSMISKPTSNAGVYNSGDVADALKAYDAMNIVIHILRSRNGSSISTGSPNLSKQEGSPSANVNNSIIGIDGAGKQLSSSKEASQKNNVAIHDIDTSKNTETATFKPFSGSSNSNDHHSKDQKELSAKIGTIQNAVNRNADTINSSFTDTKLAIKPNSKASKYEFETADHAYKQATLVDRGMESESLIDGESSTRLNTNVTGNRKVKRSTRSHDDKRYDTLSSKYIADEVDHVQPGIGIIQSKVNSSAVATNSGLTKTDIASKRKLKGKEYESETAEHAYKRSISIDEGIKAESLNIMKSLIELKNNVAGDRRLRRSTRSKVDKSAVTTKSGLSYRQYDTLSEKYIPDEVTHVQPGIGIIQKEGGGISQKTNDTNTLIPDAKDRIEQKVERSEFSKGEDSTSHNNISSTGFQPMKSNEMGWAPQHLLAQILDEYSYKTGSPQHEIEETLHIASDKKHSEEVPNKSYSATTHDESNIGIQSKMYNNPELPPPSLPIRMIEAEISNELNDADVDTTNFLIKGTGKQFTEFVVRYKPSEGGIKELDIYNHERNPSNNIRNKGTLRKPKKVPVEGKEVTTKVPDVPGEEVTTVIIPTVKELVVNVDVVNNPELPPPPLPLRDIMKGIRDGSFDNLVEKLDSVTDEIDIYNHEYISSTLEPSTTSSRVAKNLEST